MATTIQSTPTDFCLRGEFAGLVRTPAGKKRLILKVDGAEVLLKVQRELRAELAGRLTRGEAIEVSGVVRTELFTGETKRIVTQVRQIDTEPRVRNCTIRICAKKNCWKLGGKALWRAFETEIAGQDLKDAVRLKAVSCLDECKHGPNLECHGQIHRHCSAAQVPALLSQLAGHPEAPGRSNRA